MKEGQLKTRLWNSPTIVCKIYKQKKGSLVTSSLIRETTENESANEGYRFGQEEETYNINLIVNNHLMVISYIRCSIKPFQLI